MNLYKEILSTPTENFGSCPKCGSKESKIIWGWDGSYYDLICSGGHQWTYDFKRTVEEPLYLKAVKLARARSQNDPGYFTGGFDIVKKIFKYQDGKTKSSPNSYETGGFDIMKKWQRKQKQPRSSC